MFTLPPKDKYSPILFKLNIFTLIYIPILFLLIYFTGNLYKLGRYENLSVVLVLAGLEIAKYYFFKTAITDTDSKIKSKKSYKLEKAWKIVCFNSQMIVVIYLVAVLLGAQLLNKFQETLMLSVLLVTVAILPVTLYIEIDDLCQLLGLLTAASINSYTHVFIWQLELTLFGAWLGATVIPLDWNREWQVWPNSCIYGGLAGFLMANLYYVIQSAYITRSRKNQKFKNVL